MSQEKAQLIAPQGHFTVPGLNVAGVVTASSFSGNCTGTASSLTQGSNVVVGVMTASSFAGDVFGNAAGLSTTTAGLKLGIVTSTSFAGNFTGIGSGLTGTPNIVAGLVTATQFVGNTPGLAAGLSAGKNLAAGIITATTFFGDGSNLTGAGSTAFIRQTVGSGTTIDLNNGNIILFEHVGDTTVSFANTSTADDVTFIRPLTDPTAISISTGGVDFDANGDFLSLASTSDFDFGSTGDFTIELWAKVDGFSDTPYFFDFRDDGSVGGTTNRIVWYFNGDSGKTIFWKNGSAQITATNGVTTGTWSHYALVRKDQNTTMYINGLSQGSISDSTDYGSGGSPLVIGQRQGSYSATSFDGVLSNVRIVKGRALYTTDFYPPSTELTNVADTKLLCCQSDSSTTTAAVTPGTITANGDPTAGAQTLTLSPSLGSAITWPTGVTWNGGSAPTLIGSNVRSTAGQVFNLVTADGGTTWYGYEEVDADTQTFTLWGAGATGYGALGTNYAPSPATYFSSPVQIPGTTWSSLSENTFTGSASGAIKSDGTFWVWGKTNGGILGLNEAGAGLSDSKSSPIQLGTETTWNNVSFGGNDSAGCMAIKTDGTLWAWGQNENGTLGQNNNVDYSSPVQIPGTIWKWVNYAGEDYILAIKTDGTLWRWGGNPVGAGGDNLPGTSPARRSSPVQVPGTTWAYAAGNRNGHTIATKTDGTLWCWGDNSKGQLGQNTNAASSYSGYSSPVQVPGTTWSSEHGSKIAAAYQRVFAIKTDGTLWGWGRTHQGQLGQNEGGYKDYSSPVQIPGTNWDSISSVGEVMATKTDGTLWSWGDQGHGKGMLNSNVDRSSPTQVPGTWRTGARSIMSDSPSFALRVE